MENEKKSEIIKIFENGKIRLEYHDFGEEKLLKLVFIGKNDIIWVDYEIFRKKVIEVIDEILKFKNETKNWSKKVKSLLNMRF